MNITKEGTTLTIDGTLRQISVQDTIFCPCCGEEVIYWQIESHYKLQQFLNETHK